MGGMWQRAGRGFAHLALVGSLVSVGAATLLASSGPAAADPGLSFGALTVSSWTVNQAGFTGTIAVSGGTGPYTLTAQSGLPPGLTATLTGGTISFTGTPSAAGVFASGSVTVKDADGITATDPFSITIDPPLSFGALTVSSWTPNQAGFTGTIAVNGGTGPYTLTAQSGLPPGLTAVLTGGTISFTGTPNAAGVFASGSVTIKDSSGAAATDSFSITIDPLISFGALTVSSWTVNQAGFTGTIAVSGGTGPYTLTAQSGLPPGLTATLTGGTISFTGTPSAAGVFASGSVTVKDADGITATDPFSITIDPPLSFGALTVSSWTPNQAGFTGTIAVNGGTGPYTLTAQSGLPPGLTAVLTAGTISFTGTPNAAGVFASGSVTIKDKRRHRHRHLQHHGRDAARRRQRDLQRHLRRERPERDRAVGCGVHAPLGHEGERERAGTAGWRTRRRGRHDRERPPGG